MSFEEKLNKLEKIANELENGKLNLDESVKLFEDGMKLSKECNEILEHSERKIKLLIEKEEKIIEEDFETNNG